MKLWAFDGVWGVEDGKICNSCLIVFNFLGLKGIFGAGSHFDPPPSRNRGNSSFWVNHEKCQPPKFEKLYKKVQKQQKHCTTRNKEESMLYLR